MGWDVRMAPLQVNVSQSCLLRCGERLTCIVNLSSNLVPVLAPKHVHTVCGRPTEVKADSDTGDHESQRSIVSGKYARHEPGCHEEPSHPGGAQELRQMLPGSAKLSSGHASSATALGEPGSAVCVTSDFAHKSGSEVTQGDIYRRRQPNFGS